ncbi:MAG TPA: ubiquinone/menaquinone biosynthesis methyltransferase, partial [Bacteroidota bacterium]|nr:ubiquinone/menaquinone biosynthesis methyltransferase [Bacteroidota bacterium]
CATGTGDLAIAFANRLNGQSEVIGMDFNEDMMAIAKQKAAKEGKKIKFETGDVMALNYPDNYFDLASISFGIRNVDNPKKGLSEMARVVKPGGKVLVLEFGQPDDWFKIPYNFYNKFIPTIGKMIAKDKSAYTYLPNTTQRFPAGDKFVKIMQETDKFSDIYCKKLTHGVCYLYIGIVK